MPGVSFTGNIGVPSSSTSMESSHVSVVLPSSPLPLSSLDPRSFNSPSISTLGRALPASPVPLPSLHPPHSLSAPAPRRPEVGVHGVQGAPGVHAVQAGDESTGVHSGISHMEQLGDFFNSLEKKYHHLDLQLGIPGRYLID